MSILSSIYARFNRMTAFDFVYEFSRVVLLLFVLLLILPPMLFAISISLRPQTQFFDPLTLVPEFFQFKWYVQSFQEIGWMLENTYLRAVGSSILGLTLAIPAAYVIARDEFPGRVKIFWSIAGVQVFPVIILVVPLMVVYFSLGIHDTIPGLWIADQIFALPFSIWILRDYFNSMPVNLEEAAQVYGCTPFSAFVRVILPLTLPAMLAVGFLMFVGRWNGYLFAQLLTGPETRVAIIDLVSISYSGTQVHWGRAMAKTVILSAPPAILYLVARRSMQKAFALG